MEAIHMNLKSCWITAASWLAVALAFMMIHGDIHANGSSITAPSMHFAEIKHDFGAALEGESITHDFTFSNNGAEVLKIMKVKTTCGCVASTYTKETPPGKKGIIKVQVNTRGYAGRKMTKSVRVFTNDPATPQISLTMSGAVEGFADISPGAVRLNGPVGLEVVQKVKISPNPHRPFSITKITTSPNPGFEWRLDEVGGSPKAGYMLTVKDSAIEPERYAGSIFLHTDNKANPKLQLRVHAQFY